MRAFKIVAIGVVVGATAFFALSAAAMMWAMHQSRERTSCYQSGKSIESCGEPSFIERKMAHYIAHVDL